MDFVLTKEPNHTRLSGLPGHNYAAVGRVAMVIAVFVLSVASLTCIGFTIISYLIRTNQTVRRFFTTYGGHPEALPPPAVLCEVQRLQALERGVDGAVLIGEENKQLLSATRVRLTPVSSRCEGCRELCSTNSSCSTLDVAISGGCLATRQECGSGSSKFISGCDRCTLGYPKRIRDLCTDRVFELYVNRSPDSVYGTAKYTSAEREVSNSPYLAWEYDKTSTATHISDTPARSDSSRSFSCIRKSLSYPTRHQGLGDEDGVSEIAPANFPQVT